VIERVAVVPHPPLLVPELVVADDPDVRVVRDACLAVAAELAAATPRWVGIGADSGGPRDLGADAAGTFRGFGVDVVTRLSGSDNDSDNDTEPDPALPLPALVAGWLRERAGATEVPVHLVAPDLPPAECAAFGARLAAELAAEPVGLLVLGDGSHRHGERAVGRPDPRAAAFDDAVHAALAAADPAALRDLDPALAAELGAVGRAPWQVLAGAVAADGRRWKSTDARQLVPFGVAYHLAVWEPVR
jgi:aromatic ring-opening dioxygenase LigB subunit